MTIAATAAEATDVQLLARYAARRDRAAEVAFEALVRRHGPMVLRVCHQVLGDRHTAEDAFQATFLILARRAGSIRQPELLGNWLHGVALRTAREARMRDDRRRRRESAGVGPVGVETVGRAPRPEGELVRREELEALHEEVARLPERYRMPVILCDLEGLTHREAARRLHCPLGTIGVRLLRARERLRSRRTRRGIAPTAGLLAALLAGDAPGLAMPSPLVASTVQAAMGFAWGPPASVAFVSPPVLALAERVTRKMVLGRMMAAVGMAVTVAAALVLWFGGARPTPTIASQAPARSRPAGPSAPEARPDEPPPAAPSPDDRPAHPASPTGPMLADGGTAPVAAPVRGSGVAGGSILQAAPDGGATPAPPTTMARVHPPTPEEQSRGAVLFAKEWAAVDPRSAGGDGLGPVYNDTSCVACHSLGAPGGAGPENKNVVLVTASQNGCGPSGSLGRLLPGLRNARSAVLHRSSTDPGYAAWRSRLVDPPADPDAKPVQNGGEDPVASRISALRERSSPEWRRRDRSQNGAAVNGFNLTFVERNTPPLFGAGLIDEIPSEVLLALAESQPREVRGRVGRTREGRIGRFGWKGQIPSLHEFVRVACANELGLEVPGHSQAPSPLAPGSKPIGLDLTDSDCDALVSYVRALPAPVAVDPDGPQGTRDLREGRRLFAEVGCATCHAPMLGDVKGIYSDLLLHDMGQSLSDPGSTYGIESPGDAKGPTPREWRTPPLWGYRDSGPYLHDGRAQGLEEAVALHDGQAKNSAHQFFALSWRQRGQVEAFLKSLVAPSAAAAPGLVLAADLESRFERERRDPPESRVRQMHEAAVKRDEQRWREARRHEFAQDAAKRARARLPLAQSLEKMGKTTGAINFYREIARDAAGTDEGRMAAERINILSTRMVTP
jgi:RNA polymerase sigma factor (sigma-70 family)